MGEEVAVHVAFFPLMTPGHMIPLFDVVRLFTNRGVKATIITTPANAAFFTTKSDNINLEIIPFPSEKVGLPAGVENMEHVKGDDTYKFLEAMELLETEVESVLRKLEPRPICLVADTFFSWASDVAIRVGIQRLAFHGGGYFAMAVMDAMRIYKPEVGVESEDEEFVVPGLPGEVKLTKRKTTPPQMNVEKMKERMKFMEAVLEAEKKSYGVIMNSFEELEPLYAEHYRKVMGRRTWSIGPLSLACYRSIEEKAARGKKAALDEHECLRWLDSKPPNSVIYICFGSLANINTAQLHNIAHGLESSRQNFIWVVRKGNDDAEDEEWLPSGFETRTQGNGLIIRGWAPQVMILDHVATGGFMTHCGWNSTLEGISAGVTMVTWPMFEDQFINEKLITEILKVGVSVGADRYSDRLMEDASVGREAVEMTVRRAMVGEEAEELRRRVGELKEMAWKAVEEGGSSYNALTDLLEELRSFHVAQ